jgi:hypothetical protein
MSLQKGEGIKTKGNEEGREKREEEKRRKCND